LSEDLFERARREMLPQMKNSTLCAAFVGEPDAKLCMEIGAAILYDKPIVAIVFKGRPVPLSLRTIAHKLIEVDDMSPAEMKRIEKTIKEVLEEWDFRKGGVA
jgi:hypothetical protein